MAFVVTGNVTVRHALPLGGRCARRALGGRTSKRRVAIVAPRGCASNGVEYETGALIDGGVVAPSVGDGVVGVYGIHDANGALRHVAISRDCSTSLMRALVRQPGRAHSYRLRRFARPSRAALESVRAEWAAEASDADDDWGPLDVTSHFDDARRKEIDDLLPQMKVKELKQACRAVQKNVEEELSKRGLTEKIPWAPKPKQKGILDVLSAKIEVPESI